MCVSNACLYAGMRAELINILDSEWPWRGFDVGGACGAWVECPLKATGKKSMAVMKMQGGERVTLGG